MLAGMALLVAVFICGLWCGWLYSEIAHTKRNRFHDYGNTENFREVK